MEDRLKPCPFCGGEAEVIGHYIKGVANNYQYFVRCKSCKARPRSYCTFKKKEKAIEAWNTRKLLDRIVEELESQCSKTVSMGRMNGKTLTAGFNLGILKAIEIAKNGGKDE